MRVHTPTLFVLALLPIAALSIDISMLNIGAKAPPTHPSSIYSATRLHLATSRAHCETAQTVTGDAWLEAPILASPIDASGRSWRVSLPASAVAASRLVVCSGHTALLESRAPHTHAHPAPHAVLWEHAARSGDFRVAANVLVGAPVGSRVALASGEATVAARTLVGRAGGIGALRVVLAPLDGSAECVAYVGAESGAVRVALGDGSMLVHGSDVGRHRCVGRDSLGAAYHLEPRRVPDPVAGTGADELAHDGMDGRLRTASPAPVVLTLVVGYTTPALQEAGSHAALELDVVVAVDELNTALADSNVTAVSVEVVSVVHLPSVTDEATTPMDTMLDAIRDPGDGYGDGLPRLRDAMGANMGALIVSTTATTNACGLGYVIASFHARSSHSYQYSISRLSCARSAMTLAHEIGHVLGCGHDAAAGSPGMFAHSAGYVAPANAFRTIMAYGDGIPRIAHFSNPTIAYSGIATGTPTANNAATIAATAPFLAPLANTTSCSVSADCPSAPSCMSVACESALCTYAFATAPCATSLLCAPVGVCMEGACIPDATANGPGCRTAVSTAAASVVEVMSNPAPTPPVTTVVNTTTSLWSGTRLITNIVATTQTALFFPALGLPPAARVVAAALRLVGADYPDPSGTLYVAAEKSPAAAALSTTALSVSSRSPRTTTVSFVLNSVPLLERGYTGVFASPALTTAVQELADTPGWTAASDAVVMVWGSSQLFFESAGVTPATLRPVLEVAYDFGGALCGNGAVDGAEECDVNLHGAACCSPTCLAFVDGFSCNDGVFCNGVDVCSGAVCVSPGDPCAGADECSAACNETLATCTLPNATPCAAPTPSFFCVDGLCANATVCAADADCTALVGVCASATCGGSICRLAPTPDASCTLAANTTGVCGATIGMCAPIPAPPPVVPPPPPPVVLNTTAAAEKDDGPLAIIGVPEKIGGVDSIYAVPALVIILCCLCTLLGKVVKKRRASASVAPVAPPKHAAAYGGRGGGAQAFMFDPYAAHPPTYAPAAGAPPGFEPQERRGSGVRYSNSGW